MKDKKILILGLGNLLLRDEGLGVRLLQELEREFLFPEEVLLHDGGTGAFFLLPYLSEAERVIIIDAVKAGSAPGTIFFEPLSALPRDTLEKISLHEISLPDLLRILEFSGKKFEEVFLAGIEPKSLEVGLELSEEVKRAMPELKEKILSLLRKWGISFQKVSMAP